MAFFQDLLDGVASGFHALATNKLAAGSTGSPQQPGRIARLCRDLNWAVHEQEGNLIRLHFKDPLAGIRKLLICSGDEEVLLFGVHSNAILPVRNVPDQVFSHLLLRNCDVSLGAWHVKPPDENGYVMFGLFYHAFGAGLTTSLFRFTCESMVAEAIEFDAKMDAAGLLR